MSHPSAQSTFDYSQLAFDWRAGFFAAIFASFQRGEQSPDIDIVHREVLDRLLLERGVGMDIWDVLVREKLVSAWHHQLRQLVPVFSYSTELIFPQ